MNDWPDGAPSRTKYNWRGFSLDHDEDQAASRFQELFGTPPEWIVPFMNVLWVGPIKRRNNGTE